MTNTGASQDTAERKWLQVFLWIVVAILALQVGAYFLIQCWQGAERGSFGDMFGSVNTLFSGLAFAALVVTVLMQRDEIRLQFRELEKSRVEFEKTAAAQEAMLALAKEEKNSRELRERRASTLTLYPWKRHDGEHREDGVLAWRFSATNLGAMVTGICVTLESSSRVGALTMNPCPILPTDGKLTLTFRQLDEKTTWIGKGNWPSARFRLEYVDATGEKRTQVYELEKYGEGSISCLDLGIEKS